MSFALQRPLAEILSESLLRAGLGTAESAGADVVALAKSLIRQAQEHLYYEALWLFNRKLTTISLVQNQTDYEWPDDTVPGRILRVSAYTGTFEWTLDAGLRPEDRGAFNQTITQYTPTRWDHHDGIFEVWPAPRSASPATLRIEYHTGPAVLAADDDRPNCDAEAIILYTVQKLCVHFDRPGAADAAKMLASRIDRIKAQQDVPQQWALNRWREDDEMMTTRQRPWWRANWRP